MLLLQRVLQLFEVNAALWPAAHRDHLERPKQCQRIGLLLQRALQFIEDGARPTLTGGAEAAHGDPFGRPAPSRPDATASALRPRLVPNVITYSARSSASGLGPLLLQRALQPFGEMLHGGLLHNGVTYSARHSASGLGLLLPLQRAFQPYEVVLK